MLTGAIAIVTVQSGCIAMRRNWAHLKSIWGGNTADYLLRHVDCQSNRLQSRKRKVEKERSKP